MQSRLKASLGFALLATACTPAGTVPTDAERAQIVSEVTTVLTDLTDAMNRHDAEAVFEFYAEDPSFVYLGCTEYITGGATFRRLVAPYYSANKAVSFEQSIVSVQVLSPTTAVASQRGASSEAEALFWTQALVRRGGRWIITYEHESWPGCDAPREPHPYTTPEESAGLLPGNPSN